MKLFSRKPKQPSRRQVTSAGRTNTYAYYGSRSSEPAALGRQIFREALNARTARKAARYSVQRFGLLLIIIAVGVALVSLLSLSTDPKVLPVDSTEPVFLHPMAVYERAAAQFLSESLLNHNKLTIDTAGVAARMKRQFPELSIVNVTLPLVGHRPIIYLAQADPTLLLQANDGHVYVVDTNGRAIGNSATMSTGSLQLQHVRDNSGTPVVVGQSILSASTVGFIQTIAYQMSQKHLVIATFSLPPQSSELDMYLDGPKYFVKFNLASATAQQQVGAFLAVKHNLEERGITPSSYIDVRLDGRAYYK